MEVRTGLGVWTGWPAGLVLLLLAGTAGTLGQTLISAPLEDNFLLIGGGSTGMVHQLSLDGYSQYELNVSAGGNVVGVDFDPFSKKVYWTDTSKHAIFRANLNGTQVENLLQLTEASSPEGVAVDLGAGLMFFTDSGRATVCVYSLATREYRTLFSQAKHPRTIRLDRARYQLYWTDWGLQTIERMQYDGNNHAVLVHVKDSWINGLSLDLTESKMYWTDSYGNWINSSSIDGQHQADILKINTTQEQNDTSSDASHLYGVTADQNFLYFTDWYKENVYRVRLDGSDLTPIGPEFPTMYGIVLYSRSQYISGPVSPCIDNNGHCSHICIPTSIGVASCDCPDNRRLESEGSRNCTNTNGPDLIWLEYDGYYTGYVRGISGAPQDYLATKEVRTWTVRSPAWHWTAADADYHRNSLILLDKFDKLVVMMSLNGTKAIRGLYYGTSSEANGIAVDWLAGNVYWTDALYNHIMAAKIEENTNMSLTLISTDLDKPHGIAVYPQKGLLFWTDWGQVNKIESSTLAGDKRQVLVGKNLKNPTGLVIDFDTDRLYWSNKDSLESVELDGTNRRLYGIFPSNQFVDIGLYGDYLFATDKGTSSSKPYLWFYRLDDTEGRGTRLGLARRPYGILMYHAQRQPKADAPCERMGCEHMCVSAPGGAQCLCKDGFHLQSDRKTCQRDMNLLERGYTYSLGDRLCSVQANQATSQLDRDPTLCIFNRTSSAGHAAFEFHALDFNSYSGEVIFSDAKFKMKSIRRASWNDKNNNSILIHGTGVVEGIALDWTTSHMYWTDSTYKQMWVSRQDGVHQKILLVTENKPGALVVDPLRKKLYWVERSMTTNTSVIRVCATDGTRVRDFVADSLSQPTGLAIDFRLERLYWADLGNGRIEYMTLDGRDRVVQRLPAHRKYYPYDVAILQDYIAFTERDELADRSGLRVVEKDTGREVNNGFFSDGHVAYDVVAIDRLNQPLQTRAGACSINNGRCEQLCLYQDVNSYACSCIDGMQLRQDNRTCKPKYSMNDDFFLLADDYRHQIYQLNADMSLVAAINFPSSDRPIGLDYDFTENRIYWTDFTKGVIKRAYLDGSRPQVIREDMKNSRVDGLAFEPEARLLYFADLQAHVIGILNPSGEHRKILIAEDLLQPRSIVLDPNHGYMYFSSKGKIERADMDGLGRFELVNTTLGWISGLTLDLEGEQLYWCDHHAESISMVDLDGKNRRLVHRMDDSADPFSLALVRDSIYWTDWNLRGISRIDSDGQNFELLHKDFFTGLNDLKYYSSSKLHGPNKCTKNNGGCSHFCIPTPVGRTCACPDNKDGPVMVSADRLNCPGVAVCGRNILHGRIDHTCTRRLGDRCSWTCEEGYSPITHEPLLCQHGMEWNQDLNYLCKDTSCELLTVPANAQVNEHCPFQPGEGAICQHTCVDGFTATGGDSARLCLPNGFWNGTGLICAPADSRTGNILSGPSKTLVTIIALAVTFLIALVAIIIIGVCLCRRYAKKSGHGHVRENLNLTPAQTNGDLVAEPATVYDATSDRVKLDAALAFANPGYVTHEEARATRTAAATAAQAPPLPVKEPLDGSIDTEAKPKDDTSFTNPMYHTPGSGRNKTEEQEEGHYDTIPAFRPTVSETTETENKSS